MNGHKCKSALIIGNEISCRVASSSFVILEVNLCEVNGCANLVSKIKMSNESFELRWGIIGNETILIILHEINY